MRVSSSLPENDNLIDALIFERDHVAGVIEAFLQARRGLNRVGAAG